jgi:nucleosome binding factor SPN SPT16 subunit
VLPTVNCLVDLIETPFLVVTLKEIEVVNLERVGFALKNFDMAIVFKDFTREVHRIDAIDSRNLDTIKEWLNSVNIKYYESKMNLNWKPILKTILDDPQKFVEEGGWDFLDLEKSDEEDEEEEESDGA